MKYILGIDEGTTSERVVLYDINKEKIIDSISFKIKNSYPQNGWVEQNPEDIINGVLRGLNRLINKYTLTNENTVGIGITNQRETTVAWNRTTGESICPAIVWQCRRTAPFCDALNIQEKQLIKNETGLIVDPYFSATKMRWILDNDKVAQNLLKSNDLCLGTVDSFLVYRLSRGESFITDVSNASRTMLVSLKDLAVGKYEYSSKLLKFFNIDANCLAKITNSSGNLAVAHFKNLDLPILSIIGDQQASLFGQGCIEKGKAKNTYGTGCFFMVNVGEKEEFCRSNKLLGTVAWGIDGKVNFALEGSIFNAGSITSWFKDKMKFFKEYKEIDKLCLKLKSNEGVYLLPAFTGLGAPHWNSIARAKFEGLTLNTSPAHFVRAGIESICFSTMDIIEYAKSCGITINEMVCDGGLTKSQFLMQFQTDILNLNLYKSAESESTVMGAIYLAGLAGGVYKNYNDIHKHIKLPLKFIPKMKNEDRLKNIEGWKEIIEKL